MLRRQKWAIVVVLFAALAIFAIDAGARSQRPPPREGKPSQPEQTQSQGAQQPPAADQRGTENSPFIVKAQPTTKTQAQTDQEAKDRLDQAAYNGDTLFLSWLLVIVAFLQFVGIGIQAYFLWLAFGATEQTAAIAKKALISSNRPWINVSVGLFGPIVFDENGATFQVRFGLKNIGMSPATTVEVWPRIILGYAIDHKPVIDMGAELENIIKEQKTMPKGTEKFGYSIFPNEEIERDIRVVVQNSEIQKSVGIKGYISPTLIGAARYKLAQDSEMHYTGFIVYIDKREAHEGDRKGHPGIIPHEGNVLAENLIFWVPSIFGSYAD
jgi:hypothetical protein